MPLRPALNLPLREEQSSPGPIREVDELLAIPCTSAGMDTHQDYSVLKESVSNIQGCAA